MAIGAEPGGRPAALPAGLRPRAKSWLGEHAVEGQGLRISGSAMAQNHRKSHRNERLNRVNLPVWGFVSHQSEYILEMNPP